MPSNSELLRATPSCSEWGAPKNSELLRATPSHSELLRATSFYQDSLHKGDTLQHTSIKYSHGATPSWGRPRTPSYSEQLRAASELRIGSTKLPGNRRKLGTPNFLYSEHSKLLRATPSYSEWGAPKSSELFRATPSHSELLRATRALRARIDFAGLRSYSELLRARGAQELRATQSQSE